MKLKIILSKVSILLVMAIASILLNKNIVSAATQRASASCAKRVIKVYNSKRLSCSRLNGNQKSKCLAKALKARDAGLVKCSKGSDA